jgi:hypothetical protein
MIGKNQCTHGSLARACYICELEMECAMLRKQLENAEALIRLGCDCLEKRINEGRN